MNLRIWIFTPENGFHLKKQVCMCRFILFHPRLTTYVNRPFWSSFWMPELASYSFHLFYSFFGKHDKSSVLSWKYCFGKKYSVICSVEIYFQKGLFQQFFQAEKIFSFSKILRCLYEKRAAVTSLIDKFLQTFIGSCIN